MNVGEQFLAGSLAKRCPQEGNPIVQVASLFNQLLQHFPRTEFAALVKKHAAERAAKGFSCWTQFVSMLFCPLGRADSLREICNGLGCCLGRLVHVGILRAPCRSTLSYANEHRPAALFEDLFFTALARFRQQQGLGARQHKFRFKNKLLSLDSTTISLCLNLFPWARFRRAKGGVKAHVLLDHDDYLPAYVLLTEAKRSDVKLADSFQLNPGSIVAIDRGYIDYALFARWSMAEVFFVTRLKDNAAFEVVAESAIPENRNIRADQFIRLTGAHAQADYPDLLRRIVAWDAENQREIVLLTNLMEFAASTVAAIYRERWQIELKQNLRIKTFVGTSANALKTQIWTALIALLAVKFLQLQARFCWSLSRLIALLRQQLFVYRDLWRWLESPFEPPVELTAEDVPQIPLVLVAS